MEESTKGFTLKASMIDYTCATLSDEDSEECQQLIFDYYASQLETIYNFKMKELMTGQQHLSDSKNDPLKSDSEARNIVSCLDRIQEDNQSSESEF